MDAKLFISATLIILVLISGIWLSLLGRPLNTILFSAHKIIAVATVLLIVVSVLKLIKGIELQPSATWALIISGISLFLAFASGAILSFEKLVNNFTTMLHRFTPYLAVVSLVITWMMLR